MQCLWTNFVIHLVDNPGVGESASGHDQVVSSSTAITVVILLLYAFFVEISSGGRVFGNGSSWGNVVGGDEVSERGQTVSALDVFDFLQLGLDILEERRVLNVGGVVPLIDAILTDWQLVPTVSALGDLVVVVLEHLGLDHLFDQLIDFLLARPDLFQKHVLPIFIHSDRSLLEVDVHCACQSVGHHQRRGSQVVTFGQLVHTSLEVSIP